MVWCIVISLLPSFLPSIPISSTYCYSIRIFRSNVLIHDDCRCLYGEMKVRDAILKGTTEAEQLELIYKLFGTPSGYTMLLCYSAFFSLSLCLSLSFLLCLCSAFAFPFFIRSLLIVRKSSKHLHTFMHIRTHTSAHKLHLFNLLSTSPLSPFLSTRLCVSCSS